MYEMSKRPLPLQASKMNARPQNTAGTYDNVIQMASRMGNSAFNSYVQENQTTQLSSLTSKSRGRGLPSSLRDRFEAKHKITLDDVRVHYNSDKPAEIGAGAYAKGNEIHLSTGQERHLEHELGHVVQQKQGRVSTTGQISGKAVNCDADLEKEADKGVPDKPFSNSELSGDNQPIQADFGSWISQTDLNKMTPEMQRSAITEYMHAQQYAPDVQKKTPLGESGFAKSDPTYAKNKIMLGRLDDLNKRRNTHGKRDAAWAKANRADKLKNFLYADVWSPEVNQAFIGGGIDASARFKFFSDLPDDAKKEIIEISNSGSTDKGKYFKLWLEARGTVPELYNGTGAQYPLTVTAIEIMQLLDAGYIFDNVPSSKGASETFQAFSNRAEADEYKTFKLFNALPR